MAQKPSPIACRACGSVATEPVGPKVYRCRGCGKEGGRFVPLNRLGVGDPRDGNTDRRATGPAGGYRRRAFLYSDSE